MRWNLLKTLLWLRWRLSSNQLRKAGRFMRFLLVILTALALGALAGALIAGFFLGLYPLAGAGVDTVMYVVDGAMIAFLFFWVIGVLAEIQRSESIDLQRLLHLPVTLKDAFVVNFFVSHVTLSVAIILPLITGMSAGLVAAGEVRKGVLLPLFLCFLFLISGWTYCLRGWLVQLMVNPRRRRTIIIALTMSVVLAGQIPNLFFNVLNRGAFQGGRQGTEAIEKRMEQMRSLKVQLHYYLPPLWVGWGMREAAEGVWWPAVAVAGICVAGGAAGLSRAYRSTLRFYRGEGAPKSPPRTAAPRAAPEKVIRPLEGRFPFAPDDVSGAAVAFLRSLSRAPELKMALLGPLLMVGVLILVLAGRDFGNNLRKVAPLAAIGMTVFSFSGLLQLAFNQFGWDRTGFRALVLLPAGRSKILLAKNVAASVIMAAVGLLVYIAISIFLRVSLLDQAAGWMQVVAAIVMLCILGNYLSIVLPVRMNLGSLKPTKMPVVTALIMMALTLLLPAYMFPIMIGPILGLVATLSGSGFGPWVNLTCSSIVLGLALVAHRLTLAPFGRLFWEREQRILEVVTAEIE